MLTVKRHIANFPVGIANSAFYRVIRHPGYAGILLVVVGLGFVLVVHGGPNGPASWLRLPAGLRGRCAASSSSDVGRTICWVRSMTSHRSGTRSPPASPWWPRRSPNCEEARELVLLDRRRRHLCAALDVVKRLDLTAIVYVLFLSMCSLGLA